MTPEEKAVIKAAQQWVKACNRKPNHLAVTESIRVGYALRDAVAALKVSRQPLHTVAPIPCGQQSSTGAMLCELPAGHDPDDSLDWSAWGPALEYATRWHEGRASNDSARSWRTIVFRDKEDAK